MKIIQATLPFILIFTLLMESPVINAQTSMTSEASDKTSTPVTEQGGDYLDKARNQLEKAFSSYQQNNLTETRMYLNNAQEWLTNSSLSSYTEKVKSESRKLAQDIEQFRQKIAQPSDQHENTLARFWYQATSMIKRETDKLIHGYIELSTAEKTLKHLLDAKMHLFTAEHDLFVSYDLDDSTEELTKVIDYLDEAGQVAISSIKIKVESLNQDILKLKKAKAPSVKTRKQDEMLLSLEAAFNDLNQAKQNATPVIKLRITALQHNISELSDNIGLNNLKKDYDSAMTRLKNIILEL